MDTIPRVDKVQLHMILPDVQAYKQVICAVYWTAEAHGVSSKKIDNTSGSGRYLRINIDGDTLEIAAMVKCGRYWVMYRFNGAPSYWNFINATDYFQQYNFSQALLYGHVKALELAVDIPGLQPDDYLLHLVGSRTSFMFHRHDDANDTAYSGSRNSPTQLIMYDKARELKEKHQPCDFDKLMRIELRLRDRKEGLGAVIVRVVVDDPFRRALIIEKSRALELSCMIPNWHLFIHASSDMGVSNALRQFPSQKKTFLRYLVLMQDHEIKPNIQQFKAALYDLYPVPDFWEQLNSHIESDVQ